MFLALKITKQKMYHCFVGSLIYHLRAVDPDGDDLIFGVQNVLGSDIIGIDKFSRNEANVYLKKPLDREVN